MRAETLGTLITRLRADTGQSLSAALGVNQRDTLVNTLQRVQEELYLNHEWPFLRHNETLTLPAGDYTASIPTDINPDRIRATYARASAAVDAEWTGPLAFLDDPGIRAPGEGDVTRSLPAMWWSKLNPDTNQLYFMFAPRSDVAVQIKVAGMLPLQPFVEDADRSTLDGTLLVMAAASEILLRQEAKDAPQKQARMLAYLRRALGNAAPFRQRIMIGGGGTPYGGSRGAARRIHVRGVD